MDAHVHLQRPFDVDRFLGGCWASLERHAREPGSWGVLILVKAREQPGLRRFREWTARDGKTPGGGWALHATEEAVSVRVTPLDGPRDPRTAGLVLVAGRQVRAARRLEVLAMGASADVPAGRPVGDTVAALAERGVPAVVPWGFGKWWLGRGREVGRLLERWASPRLFLGDNGGRPSGWPEPPLFDRARARGVHVLPGSDPLPLPAHERRAGGYGFVLAGGLDASRPWAWVHDRLAALESDPPPYGTRVGPVAFVRDQIALRLGRAPDRTPSAA